MDTPHHAFCELFAQLGLPHQPQDVRAFLAAHAPLAGDVRLEDAPFWTPAQGRLLREGLAQDGDWAEVIDQLNLALRRAG